MLIQRQEKKQWGDYEPEDDYPQEVSSDGFKVYSNQNDLLQKDTAPNPMVKTETSVPVRKWRGTLPAKKPSASTQASTPTSTQQQVPDGETIVEQDDIKTVTKIWTDECGKRWQTITKYKITREKLRLLKGPLIRKQWKHFGNARAGAYVGTCESYLGEEVDMSFLLRAPKSQVDEKEIAAPTSLSSGKVKIRIIPPTLPTTLSKQYEKSQLPPTQKYIPPAMRRGAQSTSTPTVVPTAAPTTATATDELEPPNYMALTKEWKVFVSNLNTETTWQEIKTLGGKYGYVKECICPKNKTEEGLTRGWAILVYDNKKSAQSAIRDLDGKGHCTCILSATWAREFKRHE